MSEKTAFQFKKIPDAVAEKNKQRAMGEARAYLEDIGPMTLLSREEEIELGKLVHLGQKAQQELTGQNSQIDKKELQRTIQKGVEAEDRLIKSNLRLVIDIAQQSIGLTELSFLDLIQEGNLGLIDAVKRYEYWRGTKFSTYATWLIQGAIFKAMAEKSKNIRTSIDIGWKVRKFLRFRQELADRLGRDVSVEETATKLNINPKMMKQSIELMQGTVSLDASLEENAVDLNVKAQEVEKWVQPTQKKLSLPADYSIDEEKDTEIDELIIDPEFSTEETLRVKQLKEKFTALFKGILPPREARILELRYGLKGNDDHYLSEVGRKIGVTKERVRQIESQAFSRLRQPFVKKELEELL